MSKKRSAWPDVVLKFLAIAEHKARLFWSIIILVVIVSGAGGYIYLKTHDKPASSPIIQDNGHNNQNIPVNDGTAIQSNK